jgi:hypothetical protein
MKFQLQLKQMPGYLAARFIGVGEPGEGSQQFESIAEHCERTKNNKLLIDTTEFNLKISVTSGYFAGERAKIFERYGIKVAFVGRPEQIDLGKFAALVAQNRGVKVEVFTDFQAAEEWLLVDHPRSESASRMSSPCD